LQASVILNNFQFIALKMNKPSVTGILVPAMAALLVIFSGCEDDGPCSGEPLVFSSLTVTPDTLETGEYADVVAVASGCRLSYRWSVTKGDILGTGAEVVFAASPCAIGVNTITCTVTDGNDQEETRTVPVVVR
jgi:hypothetical protein